LDLCKNSHFSLILVFSDYKKNYTEFTIPFLKIKTFYRVVTYTHKKTHHCKIQNTITLFRIKNLNENLLQITKLVSLIQTIPSTSTSAERTFSALTKIKTTYIKKLSGTKSSFIIINVVNLKKTTDRVVKNLRFTMK